MTWRFNALAGSTLAVLLGVATGASRTPHQAIPPAEQAPPAGESGDSGASERIREADDATPYEGEYRSPYRLALTHPLTELLFDEHELRGSVAQQSSIPKEQWYSEEVRARWKGWGVPQRLFECPERVHAQSIEWKQERLVASAARFIGYEYQHHHVLDWDPPQDWPWIKCCTGKQGKGVDCSTFTTWNYNWALGIHLHAAIAVQAARVEEEAALPEGRVMMRAEVIARPEGRPDEWYDQIVSQLKPGDLLYIRDTENGAVGHAIMWVGSCGENPNGPPLIIDSTGGQVKDESGHRIPSGIHLRPFRKGAWYHICFDHAHRWLHPNAVVRSAPAP